MYVKLMQDRSTKKVKVKTMEERSRKVKVKIVKRKLKLYGTD